MDVTVYKIQNKAGLFSTGGSRPEWKKVGKTWTAMNHVTAHLTLVREYVVAAKLHGNEWNPYKDAYVVQLKTVSTDLYAIRNGRIHIE